ncbi:MAG: type II toxin-antitoxin system MqsR family toxin, partial [Rhodobacteraceae bacterium]|nr:type II toxin-antitoxin system MqsR family toxin [Paracoccaceae bacterium]
MEKRKSTYDLASIRNNVSDLIFTKTALNGASEMGMTRSDMENVIENLTNRNF